MTAPDTLAIQDYNQVTIDGSIQLVSSSGASWADPDGNARIQNIGAGGISVSGNLTASRQATNPGLHSSDFIFSTTGAITVSGSIAGTSLQSAAGTASDLDFDAGSVITLVGAIDLDDVNGGSQEGHAVLTTTSGAGLTIVIGDENSPGTSTLDFDLLDYIQFESSTSESVIYQAIANFSGEGSTQIRVGSPGDVVYYDDSANPGLLGGGPNSDGIYNIGGGGTLEPLSTYVPEPTTAALLGLGGLLGITGAIRHRKRSAPRH
jgi:hypothetical protein